MKTFQKSEKKRESSWSLSRLKVKCTIDYAFNVVTTKYIVQLSLLYKHRYR